MKLATINEAAAITGFSVAFFRKAIRAGRLVPVARVDGKKNPHVFAVRDIRATARAAGKRGRPKGASHADH